MLRCSTSDLVISCFLGELVLFCHSYYENSTKLVANLERELSDVRFRLTASPTQISGGPIYVSDKPGRHDIPLLKRLVRSDGSLLRCVGVGRPTLDCLFADVMRDSTSILKVQAPRKPNS